MIGPIIDGVGVQVLEFPFFFLVVYWISGFVVTFYFCTIPMLAEVVSLGRLSV